MAQAIGFKAGVAAVPARDIENATTGLVLCSLADVCRGGYCSWRSWSFPMSQHNQQAAAEVDRSKHGILDRAYTLEDVTKAM
jgi:hypothetical protein